MAVLPTAVAASPDHKAQHAVQLSRCQLLDGCCAISKHCSRPKDLDVSSAAVCCTGAKWLWRDSLMH